jgi:glycerol-3-phosphate dehydrogenase
VVSPHSFYITAPDGRLVFILRREEDGLVYSRIGTTERPLRDEDPSDGIKPSAAEIQYLKNVVHHYFPDAPLDTANVLHLDEGIRPLQYQDYVRAFDKSREHSFKEEGRVMHVVGVKLTDFRRAAGELVRQVNWRRLGIKVNSLENVQDPLRPAGAKIYREETMQQIVSRTMALHWDDFVERRRGRKPAFDRKYKPDCFDRDLLEMGRILGWDSARIEMERARARAD